MAHETGNESLKLYGMGGVARLVFSVPGFILIGAAFVAFEASTHTFGTMFSKIYSAWVENEKTVIGYEETAAEEEPRGRWIKEECPTCHGTGLDPNHDDGTVCFTCHGQGTVNRYVPPEQ